MGDIDLQEVTEPHPEPQWHARIADIPLRLEVILGRADISVAKMAEVSRGQIITLDKRFGEILEVHIGNRLIGHGEIVTTDDGDAIGIKIVSVVGGFQYSDMEGGDEDWSRGKTPDP